MTPGIRRLRFGIVIIGALLLTACDDDSQRQQELTAQRAKELALISNMALAGPEIERRLRERIQSDGAVVIIKDSPSEIFVSLDAWPANVGWTATCGLAGISISIGSKEGNGSGVEIALSDAFLDEPICRSLIPLMAAKVTTILSGK